MAIIDRLGADLGLKKLNQTIFTGSVEGYHSVLNYNQNTNRIHLRMGFSSEAEVDTRQLVADLLLIKDVVSATQKNHMIELVFKSGLSYDPVKTAVDQAVQKTVSFLRSHNVSSGCMTCGSKDDIATYLVNDTHFYLCSNCYAEINHSFEQEFEQKRSKPINHIGGIVGALLGALIGAGIWAIVYRLGFVAWIVGFIIVLLALKGYELFGGRIGKVGMIIGVLFAFSGVLLGNYIGLCWDIFDEVKRSYDVTFFEVFGEVYKWLFDPAEKDLLFAFIKNTGLGLLAVLIGGIPLAIASMKESSGRREIKRLQ